MKNKYSLFCFVNEHNETTNEVLSKQTKYKDKCNVHSLVSSFPKLLCSDVILQF